MRIAGAALGIDDLDTGIMMLSEASDPSTWPSIKDAVPVKEVPVQYDEDMDLMAPMIKKALMPGGPIRV